ncbi:hypothetical protein M9H77_15214 [Catharanthus roseus]|uniref:Uncharacterized protein n=1 Tax=Catharanthus roseus TaxID=4058 RepID=A0ACC0AXM1_CATRO|nr:hypothetical protein M9H77_15214 [Catharanthus roseus]
MEDDEEIQSHPSGCSGSPATPRSNGRITVTVAAAPPSQGGLTLALPIQQQQSRPTGNSGGGGGGGREDCWSEGATAVLIDAWGERYLELSRGNLKQKHWKDVADIVSSREDYTKTPKTDIQCKNRIDTLRQQQQQQQQQKQKMQMRKLPSVDSDEESEPDPDSADDFPPQTYERKRPKIQREPMSMPGLKPSVGRGKDGGRVLGEENQKGGGKEKSWGNSVRELTRAILRFGEAYEQAESSKLQQLVDMEKQRMKFTKDLELQRMQNTCSKKEGKHKVKPNIQRLSSCPFKSLLDDETTQCPGFMPLRHIEQFSGTRNDL